MSVVAPTNMWPETTEELVEQINYLLIQFPGWETYEWGNEEKSTELYQDSFEIAAYIGALAVNFAGGKVGLSVLQASYVPERIHSILFGQFTNSIKPSGI